jgi:hypothetical protein
VRIVEASIKPFKVAAPIGIRYHHWSHRNVVLDAHVVTAANGSYIAVATMEQ